MGMKELGERRDALLSDVKKIFDEIRKIDEAIYAEHRMVQPEESTPPVVLQEAQPSTGMRRFLVEWCEEYSIIVEAPNKDAVDGDLIDANDDSVTVKGGEITVTELDI